MCERVLEFPDNFQYCSKNRTSNYSLDFDVFFLVIGIKQFIYVVKIKNNSEYHKEFYTSH